MADVAKKAVIIGAGISGLSMAAMLVSEGIEVLVLERSAQVGGRTASHEYRGHILDNGFHIMPFYKTSAVYNVLERLGISDRLELAKVTEISFYRDGRFFRYPKGLGDILRLDLVPPSSRFRLLRTLLPIAFSSMKKAEEMDGRRLADITAGMDGSTRSFFDAVCMLAFADTPERVSLGEFVRTIIRANPLRGGTSEFAYPADGGYDSISKLLQSYIIEKGGTVRCGTTASRVHISGGRADGVVISDGSTIAADSVIVSYPAYLAVRQLFEPGVLGADLLKRVARLAKTTSVVEVHFCVSDRIDDKQVVFPVGDYTAKGVFFITNIAGRVSPPGQYLIMSGTPVTPEQADDPAAVRDIAGRMKSDINTIYPGFADSVLWEKPMAWKLVEAVVKEPGMVWKDKMPHQIPDVGGLFFIGDSTVSYGIGTDSAVHSSILCRPRVTEYLAGS